MNLACLSFCLGVCLFVSNKQTKNGWTDRAQIFCGTFRDLMEGLWMIKISNTCLHQNSIFIKFLKILKIHEIFCENPRIIFVLFYDVHKENMFTIDLEDGREAPSKASLLISRHLKLSLIFFSINLMFGIIDDTQTIESELKTLEWWISRLMLNPLIILLNQRLF